MERAPRQDEGDAAGDWTEGDMRPIVVRRRPSDSRGEPVCIQLQEHAALQLDAGKRIPAAGGVHEQRSPACGGQKGQGSDPAGADPQSIKDPIPEGELKELKSSDAEADADRERGEADG